MNLKLALIIGLFSAAFTHANPLNFKETIEFALSNAPSLQSAKLRKLQADWNHSTAGSQFLPSLDLEASHGLQAASPKASSNPWTSSYQLGLTETLYDNGQSITGFKKTRLLKEKAEIDTDEAKNSLLLNTSSEFYKYSLACLQEKVTQEQHEALQSQFRLTDQLYKEGRKTRQDYLRLRSQVQRFDINLTRAKKSKLQQVAQLNQIAGGSLEKPLDFTPLALKPIDLKEIPKPSDKGYALESHRLYLARKLQSSANELEVNLAERKYWPQLFLTSALTYTNENYLGNDGTDRKLFDEDSLGWRAGLTLKFNLFDWGQRKRDISIAKATQTIQDNDLRQENLELKSQLESLGLDLQELSKNYTLSLELLKSEETSYEFLRKEYQQGRTSYLDLITSLDQLTSAKTQYYTAHFDLLTALSRYHYHEGTLYEWIQTW